MTFSVLWKGLCISQPSFTAKFNIRTGKVLSLPATRDVSTYPVKVEDGVVYVDA